MQALMPCQLRKLVGTLFQVMPGTLPEVLPKSIVMTNGVVCAGSNRCSGFISSTSLRLEARLIRGLGAEGTRERTYSEIHVHPQTTLAIFT